MQFYKIDLITFLIKWSDLITFLIKWSDLITFLIKWSDLICMTKITAFDKQIKVL
jgi:hypothetical protein